MDIKEIRKRNYLELRKRFRAQEDAQGIPEFGELARMARQVGISAQYLSHINIDVKPIGHASARKLEQGFDLPHGWLDVDHFSGGVPMDNDAEEFLAMVRDLYLQDRAGLRSVVMKYMMSKIAPKAT